MGYDVEVIDYRPRYIEDDRKILQLPSIKNCSSLGDYLKTSIGAFVSIPERLDANSRFDAFISTYLKLSSSIKSIKNFSKDYDLIIVGSDQIWNPQICEGYDPIYWGQFPHYSTRLAAYAASIGETGLLLEDDWEKIGKRILSFDRVSVREKQLRDALYENIGVQSSCTIDPTLLLTSTDYDELVESVNIGEEYVMAFSVVGTNNFMNYSRKIAEKLNCKLIVVTAREIPQIIRRSNRDIMQVSPSIGGFLGLIKNSKYVVTTSFHGTVFSIVYNKPFYTAAHHKGSRVRSLLSSIGLESRLIDMSNSDNICVNPLEIDYHEVDMLLSSIRSESRRYLASLCEDLTSNKS